MKDESCPCLVDKAFKIRRMTVGETSVGIAQLDQIMEEVNSMGLERNEIGRELIRRVKIFNYVPSSAGSEYEKALIEEYERRYGE
jgi:hypothetical protein